MEAGVEVANQFLMRGDTLCWVQFRGGFEEEVKVEDAHLVAQQQPLVRLWAATPIIMCCQGILPSMHC